MIRRGLTKTWAVVGLAGAQLRRRPARTMLAVVGVALAVLATTLLASAGVGVVETGQQKFAAAERDLWITGGPLAFSPTGGSFDNAILDAHAVSERMRDHEAVDTVSPILFHSVYVGANASDLQLVTGVGVKNTPGTIAIQAGSDFERGDVHYANGTYDGEMTRSVIVDPRTARLLDVGVNDTIHLGGSKSAARATEFRVVGISPTFGRFLGTPTVAVHLSELQSVTGTAGSDRATLLTARLEDGASPRAVKADLQERFPEYTIRTNREQLRALLQGNAILVASAAALVALAVVTGVALTGTLLALVVAQQRREFAALRAIGLSRWTLTGIVGAQGLVLGVLGGALGLAATPLAARGLSALAAQVVGFESLLQTPPAVYAVGGAIAVSIGLLGAVVAGWQLTNVPAGTDLA